NARTIGGAQRLHNQKTDHSCSYDQSCSFAGNLRQRDRVDSDGHGLKHGRFLKGKTVRKTVHDARGNSNELGEGSRASIVSTRDSQDLPVVKKIYVSAAAVFTASAVDRGAKGDAIYTAISSHARTHIRDAFGS